jgi:hypothetical protein
VSDWATISALATAGGTLALAFTTYASVRSANRAARVAELSLLAQLRPLLVESSENDPLQHAGFHDVPTPLPVPGGGAFVGEVGGSLYVVISLKNVGPGIAVLHGGLVYPDNIPSRPDHAEPDAMTMLRRDLYISPGQVGYWQIAYRDDDAYRRQLQDTIRGGAISCEVLYGDYEGGQRVITRFGVRRPSADDEWQVVTIRHWQLDRSEVRPRG